MELPVNLSATLFLDIETVCCFPSYREMDSRLQAEWDRKAAFIDAEISPEELFFRKAGIYAEFGRVVCISVGYFFRRASSLFLKVKSFHGQEEKKILENFLGLVSKFPQNKLILCAHNGKEFDFPFLCRRMLVNGVKLPECLNISGKKPWEVRHLDTLELWKFGDRKNYTSLELLAALFGIPGSKTEMNGSKVSEVFYREKSTERISEYCCKDVEVLARLFLKMQGNLDVNEENIIYS